MAATIHGFRQPRSMFQSKADKKIIEYVEENLVPEFIVTEDDLDAMKELSGLPQDRILEICRYMVRIQVFVEAYEKEESKGERNLERMTQRQEREREQHIQRIKRLYLDGHSKNAIAETMSMYWRDVNSIIKLLKQRGEL